MMTIITIKYSNNNKIIKSTVIIIIRRRRIRISVMKTVSQNIIKYIYIYIIYI